MLRCIVKEPKSEIINAVAMIVSTDAIEMRCSEGVTHNRTLFVTHSEQGTAIASVEIIIATALTLSDFGSFWLYNDIVYFHNNKS